MYVVTVIVGMFHRMFCSFEALYSGNHFNMGLSGVHAAVGSSSG
jgi:hypothetical protein